MCIASRSSILWCQALFRLILIKFGDGYIWCISAIDTGNCGTRWIDGEEKWMATKWHHGAIIHEVIFITKLLLLLLLKINITIMTKRCTRHKNRKWFSISVRKRLDYDQNCGATNWCAMQSTCHTKWRWQQRWRRRRQQKMSISSRNFMSINYQIIWWFH